MFRPGTSIIQVKSSIVPIWSCLFLQKAMRESYIIIIANSPPHLIHVVAQTQEGQGHAGVKTLHRRGLLRNTLLFRESFTVPTITIQEHHQSNAT